jgi:hypothetical protein
MSRLVHGWKTKAAGGSGTDSVQISDISFSTARQLQLNGPASNPMGHGLSCRREDNQTAILTARRNAVVGDIFRRAQCHDPYSS